jgi:hypothetical protein
MLSSCTSPLPTSHSTAASPPPVTKYR